MIRALARLRVVRAVRESSSSKLRFALWGPTRGFAACHAERLRLPFAPPTTNLLPGARRLRPSPKLGADPPRSRLTCAAAVREPPLPVRRFRCLPWISPAAIQIAPLRGACMSPGRAGTRVVWTLPPSPPPGPRKSKGQRQPTNRCRPGTRTSDKKRMSSEIVWTIYHDIHVVA